VRLLLNRIAARRGAEVGRRADLEAGMMELKISDKAAGLRAELLSAADMDAAAEAAQRVSHMVVEALNDESISAATHLLAQALVARASIQTASEWWSHDLAKPPLPPPETFAALFDLAVNLPVQIIGQTIDVRTGERKER